MVVFHVVFRGKKTKKQNFFKQLYSETPENKDSIFDSRIHTIISQYYISALYVLMYILAHVFTICRFISGHRNYSPSKKDKKKKSFLLNTHSNLLEPFISFSCISILRVGHIMYLDFEGLTYLWCVWSFIWKSDSISYLEQTPCSVYTKI